MSGMQILADFRRRDVALWADGDRIRWRGPKGVVIESDRSALAAHKAEILVLLRRPSAADLALFLADGAADESGQTCYCHLRAGDVQVGAGRVAWEAFVERCNADELAAVLRLLDLDDPPSVAAFGDGSLHPTALSFHSK